VKRVNRTNSDSYKRIAEKAQQTLETSQWRYDFTVYVNKQRESSDFGYIDKAPRFPTFQKLQDMLLDNTIPICPAVLSAETHLYLGLVASIVATAPQEHIGPTDLDEKAWAKVEHAINRLIDEKRKRSLTIALRLDYTTITTSNCEGQGTSMSAFSSIAKGNKKLVISNSIRD